MPRSANRPSLTLVNHRLERLQFERPDGAPEERYDIAIQFESEATPLHATSNSNGSDVAHKSSNGEANGSNGANGSGSHPIRRTLVTLETWLEWEPTPGPFDLGLRVEGIFERPDGMGEATFWDLVETEAPEVLFGHVRTLVDDVMAEAGEDFRLPAINIAEAFREQRSAGPSMN